MFITCKRFLSYYRTSIYFAFTVPDNSIPHMAMLALLSHFRDIDGLIGEVETCSKPLLLRPTQEQREKREKIKTGEQRRGMKKERERDGGRGKIKTYRARPSVYCSGAILTQTGSDFNPVIFLVGSIFPLFTHHILKTQSK